MTRDCHGRTSLKEAYKCCILCSKILKCERFDACTSESTKARIIESDGAVRIVISTVAFA